MRVLAIGAHPDDVELGAGATLAKHVQRGDEVYILVMGTGATSRDGAKPGDTLALRRQAVDAAQLLGARVAVLNFPDQRFDTVDFLALVKAVERVIEQIKPSHIYTHHADDLNLDHRLTHKAVMTACRPLPEQPARRIDAFEVPSSTEWGRVQFNPNTFVDVSGDLFQRKMLALSCYSGEMRDPPHPRSGSAIKALAQWRGATAGVPEAEAFVVMREIR